MQFLIDYKYSKEHTWLKLKLIQAYLLLLNMHLVN